MARGKRHPRTAPVDRRPASAGTLMWTTMSQENQTPDENQPDDATQTDEQHMADFAAGYGDDDSTAMPPSDDDDDQTASQAAGDGTPADEGQTEQTAPEYVQLTRQEVEELKARAALIDQIRATQDKSFGTMGGTIREIRDEIKAIKGGKRIEIDQNEIDELRKDGFEAHAKALEKLRDLQVIAGATQEQIESTVTERVEERVTRFRQEMEARLLRRVHPDWEQYQTNPDFNRWVAAQPEEYRQKLAKASNDWDSDVIADAMTKAKAAAKAAASTTTRQPQAPRTQARTSVLEAAIQPRGTGRPAPRAGNRSAEAEMLAGYEDD